MCGSSYFITTGSIASISEVLILKWASDISCRSGTICFCGLSTDYNRLTEKNSFAAFFQNHAFIINAEIPFRFGRAQTLSLGADANISVAATESHQPPNINAISAQRSDYAVYLGYSATLTRSFFINAVGTVVVRQYYEGGRDDISEILALTANYRVNKYLTVSAVSTLAASQSNQSVFDYNVANLGGAVALSVKF